MYRACWLLAGLVAFAVLADVGVAGQDDKPKNPWGIAKEPVPEDDESKTFAKNAQLSGDNLDNNAPPWAKEATQGTADKLDGLWSGRWRIEAEKQWINQSEGTKVATSGNRVYILFKYQAQVRDQQQQLRTILFSYLIVAVRDGKRLTGRYSRVQPPGEENGVYAGLIVDPERIDGSWKGGNLEGRWDLRRKLAK